jgi:hypothetical protein
MWIDWVVRDPCPRSCAPIRKKQSFVFGRETSAVLCRPIPVSCSQNRHSDNYRPSLLVEVQTSQMSWKALIVRQVVSVNGDVH